MALNYTENVAVYIEIIIGNLSLRYVCDPFDILYATTSYCFDLSIFEFFFPLMQGKTIRLLESALEIPAYVQSDEKIMINTVPSVARTLIGQNLMTSSNGCIT